MPTAYPGQPAYSTPNYQGYLETPYAYDAPDSFVVTDETTFGFVASPVGFRDPASIEEYQTSIDNFKRNSYREVAPVSFNPYNMGTSAYLSNIFRSQLEILKEKERNPKWDPIVIPDVTTKKMGFWEEFYYKIMPPEFREAKGISFGEPDAPPATPPSTPSLAKPASDGSIESPRNETVDWFMKAGEGMNQTYNDFIRGVEEGYTEEKGHEWYDLVPGLSPTSNWSFMLMLGGSILLFILIIK